MRDPKLLVYGSSYDRGLEHLLKMWPDIKKEVPDAKLRVFYGWNLFDVGYRDNPERMAWKEKMNKLMEADGITHLGRISHGAVEEEFKNAGIWAYPTHFGEISCITAMKAQAFGAIPVVINYAALSETVQHGIKVEGDIYDSDTKEEYKKALVSLLNDPRRQEEIRKEMMPWAKKFAWSEVAKQWDGEFRTGISLERRIENLMDDNQALKAWDVVKDTDSPLKDKVYQKVKHAFSPEEYREYYSNHLIETPRPEDQALNANTIEPRLAWVVNELVNKQPKSVVDLGCADGYVSLTLAKYGISTTGVNLYKPSVDIANERAKKNNLPAKFVCEDLMEHKGNYDCAVLMEVLEHLPEPRKGIDHALSLLNKGGSLYLSTPRTDHIGVELHKQSPHESWDDGKPSGHLRLWTEAEFKELLTGLNIKNFFVDQDKSMCAEVVNV